MFKRLTLAFKLRLISLIFFFEGIYISSGKKIKINPFTEVF